MEHVEAMSEGEWNNCSVMYSSSSIEEADFMAQLIGNCSLPSESSLATTTLFNWPVNESNVDMAALVQGVDESSMLSPTQGENHNASTNMYYYFSQGCNNSSGTTSLSLFPSSSYHDEAYYHHPTANDEQHQIFGATYVLETKNTNQYLIGAGDDDLNQDVSNEDINDYSNENKPIINRNGLDGMIDLQLETENDMSNVPKSSSPPNGLSTSLSKKRPRDVIVNNVQTNKRIVKPKKNRKLASSEYHAGENNEATFQKQNSVLSRTSIDEVDSNGSEELKGGATSGSFPKGDEVINSRGKSRASRGSATDPQSLYARKRRERINERLRILQNLVPNGTKVDISTMLEEAVQYVKFLQLQIKLLSSDDTWMYAPIAYNGMDIGLHRNIDASSR